MIDPLLPLASAVETPPFYQILTPFPAGGLTRSSLPALLVNASLCLAVAVTDILAPIAPSFLLIPDRRHSPAGPCRWRKPLQYQSRVHFSVLNASDSERTRLGTVLSGEAMMDEVVMFVIVRVIEEIGGGEGIGVRAGGVLRPVGLVSVFCSVFWWTVGPVWRRYGNRGAGWEEKVARQPTQRGFVWPTLLLLEFVTGASYAGTSGLFAAYLSGVDVSCWDGIDSQYPGPANDGRVHEAFSNSATASPNTPNVDSPQSIGPPKPPPKSAPKSMPKSAPDSPPSRTQFTASPLSRPHQQPLTSTPSTTRQ